MCFLSIEKIRENYNQADKRVVNNINGQPSHELVEDVICNMEASFTLESQPLSYIEFQIIDEILESKTYCELMQDNSLPLSFDSFQFLKKFFDDTPEAKNDKPIENHIVSVEPMYYGL